MAAIHLPLLGFGASPLGGVMGPMDQETANAAVDAAIAHGINHFDTSPYYGNSEEVLGRALANHPRSSYTLCTKVGRYGPQPENFDFSASRVVASVHESLRRLGVQYLDIVLMHDVEFVRDPSQLWTETVPALLELQRQGLIRALGLSGYPLPFLRRVIEQCPSGSLQYVLSYCHFNMSDTSLVEFMDFFTSRRMHVILASVLSMGLLSPKGPQSWHPAPQPLKEACRSVRELCAKADADVARMALRWSLQNLPTGISCVLVGFANEREVMDAMTVRDHREEKEDTALVEQCLHILSKVNETDRVWPSGLHQS